MSSLSSPAYKSNRKKYTGRAVIVGNSIINGIREERLSGKYGVVKVRNFPSANIEDMQHNLVPQLERNPCCLILHVGTNNAESCTLREILDKLLKLKTF